jgi:ribosomal protein L7/L12
MERREISYEEALEVGTQLFREERSIEFILSELRARGASVMESIKVLRALTKISLTEAKDVIHKSAAWSDVGDELAESHRALAEAVEREGELIVVDSREYLRIRLPEP